jgi:hypothetical protein
VTDDSSTHRRASGAGVIDRRAKIGALLALVIGGVCLAIAIAWAALR